MSLEKAINALNALHEQLSIIRVQMDQKNNEQEIARLAKALKSVNRDILATSDIITKLTFEPISKQSISSSPTESKSDIRTFLKHRKQPDNLTHQLCDDIVRLSKSEASPTLTDAELSIISRLLAGIEPELSKSHWSLI